MVNGISGIGAGVNIDALKEIIQDVVEETLEAKEAQNVSTTEEAADEEPELVDAAQVTNEEQEALDGRKHGNDGEIKEGLTGLVSTISEIMMSMMEKMMEMLGIGQEENTTTSNDSTEQISNASDKYVMTEDEKAYLTLHPDFVRDLVAKEKFEEQYGRAPRLSESNGLIMEIGSKKDEKRFESIKRNITNAEIQAYLQLNPNVIKDAIAKGQ